MKMEPIEGYETSAIRTKKPGNYPKENILHLLHFNLLVPELFFFNFSTPVYKMWIIQEPNTLELWNKLHFEEEKTESIHHV